jgi:protein SCO1
MSLRLTALRLAFAGALVHAAAGRGPDRPGPAGWGRPSPLVATAGAAGCCHGAPGSAAPEASGAGAAPRYGRTLARYAAPDVPLVDQDGRAARLPDVVRPGGAMVVSFVFTTCTTICPVMTATLARLQEALGDGASEVRMVSISIDPENDRPERLRAYARRFHAGKGWSFWTGELADVQAALAAFDVLPREKNAHRPITLVRRAGSAEWIRIDGLVPAETLAAELRPPRAER